MPSIIFDKHLVEINNDSPLCPQVSPTSEI